MTIPTAVGSEDGKSISAMETSDSGPLSPPTAPDRMQRSWFRLNAALLKNKNRRHLMFNLSAFYFLR